MIKSTIGVNINNMRIYVAIKTNYIHMKGIFRLSIFS